jgi:hypothetical protein
MATMQAQMPVLGLRADRYLAATNGSFGVRERPTGSARIFIFSGFERLSDGPVELVVFGSALLQRSRLFRNNPEIATVSLYCRGHPQR